MQLIYNGLGAFNYTSYINIVIKTYTTISKYYIVYPLIYIHIHRNILIQKN